MCNKWLSFHFHTVLGFWFNAYCIISSWEFCLKMLENELLDCEDAFWRYNASENRKSNAILQSSCRASVQCSYITTYSTQMLPSWWDNGQTDALLKIENDFTDWTGCFGVLDRLNTAWDNCCQRFLKANDISVCWVFLYWCLINNTSNMQFDYAVEWGTTFGHVKIHERGTALSPRQGWF